jgi:hypothetical protein
MVVTYDGYRYQAVASKRVNDLRALRAITYTEIATFPHVLTFELQGHPRKKFLRVQ